jgi:hypothetical protein
MGEAADRKVTEIEETRRRLEADLRDLESRLPAPVRSMKSVVGIALGSAALTAFLLRRFRSGGEEDRPSAEVVVRIVREDV